jgi:hypothetical protein
MDSACSVNIMNHYGIKVMNIELLTEYEDGGATYQFDLTKEEADAMCRNGILWAITSAATGITIEHVLKLYRESEAGNADYNPFDGSEYKTSDDYELGN